MFQPDEQTPPRPHALSMQELSPVVQSDQTEISTMKNVETQGGGHSQAGFVALSSKRLQDELKALGLVIKQYEHNLQFLMSERNKLDEAILDSQVIHGKRQSTTTSATENDGNSGLQIDNDVAERICCLHENSAASVLCQLEMNHGAQIMQLALTKDVVGIVARLGRVDDDSLSRLLSEYLGTQIMMAIVCKTHDAAMAFETYDSEGLINKKAGLHGLASSIGKPLEGRFNVVCLENLSPYPGQFVEDDLQRRLDLLKPKLPNGKCPPGFVGFAVNMINLDKSNLDYVTADGYGLRETLFYSLFGHLQVYRTRAEMIRAFPLIRDGAVSLEGGMIRSGRVVSFGKRDDVSVKFSKTLSASPALDNLAETEKNIKELKWRRAKLEDDIKRQQMLLDSAKVNLGNKKEELVKFVAQCSSYTSQTAPRPHALSVQEPSPVMQSDQMEVSTMNNVETQRGGHSQADFVALNSKRIQDVLKALGLVIKQHEHNLQFLMSERNKLDESILDSQVIHGKQQSSTTSATENDGNSGLQIDDDVAERICCLHENSAASVLCQLEMHHGAQIMQQTLTKDVVGIVARLGRVDDDNLSRLFSEYLGVRTMLAIVCKTHEAAMTFETYDSEGFINEKAGLHGLASSIGKLLEGRFDVICLENLSPYPGQFVEDDLQRRLDLLKPRLPNGECPPGFVGFAVNMINLDISNLYYVTADGYGLRETLFYSLFGHLQVYRTRAEMIRAFPLISDGAVSIDGGMIRSGGDVFSFGMRDDMSVRFSKMLSALPALENPAEFEKNIKELKLRSAKLEDDIKRERMLLESAKINFGKKKEELVKFVAQSSSYTSQMHGSGGPAAPR